MGAYLQFWSRQLNHCPKANFSKFGKGTKILYSSILTYLIFHLFQPYQMHYPNPTLGEATTLADLNHMCSSFQNYITPLQAKENRKKIVWIHLLLRRIMISCIQFLKIVVFG